MVASKGVRCIRGEIPHDECRRCAQDPLHPCQYPPDMLEGMVRDDSQPSNLAHSPSRLLGCARQAVLESQHDYYVDVDWSYPMFRGNMVHALMESTTYPDAYMTIREQRLTTLIDTKNGPREFTGKPDLIVVKSCEDGVIHIKVVDYKSKSDIGHDLVEAAVDHQIQVNLYAYLAAQRLPRFDVFALIPGLTVVVDELEIVYADMKKVRRFTSAGWLSARGKRIGRTGSNYEALALQPIRIKDMQWCHGFIRNRIERREGLTLPAVLPEDEVWKCNRCPVFDMCDALAQENSEKRPG